MLTREVFSEDVELWQWGAYWLFGYIFRRAFLPAINRFGWGHRLLQSTQGNLWKGCDKLWWPTKVCRNGPTWLIFLKRLETHRLEVLEYGHRNLSSNSFNKHIMESTAANTHRSDVWLFMINNTPPVAEEKPMGRAEEEATVISRNPEPDRHAMWLAICWIFVAFDSNRAEHHKGNI